MQAWSNAALPHIQILEGAALVSRDGDDTDGRNEKQVERSTSDDRARAELVNVRSPKILEVGKCAVAIAREYVRCGGGG